MLDVEKFIEKKLPFTSTGQISKFLRRKLLR